ncbi:hypothetical protein ACEWY4_026757 [Coilia grayii]|uniref:Uncharacterized protein n=1 Tax=Coilia grayii TaxID=363190 RepID=A0ABD1IUL7_9TELE
MERRTMVPISLGTRRRPSSALTDPLYDNCLSHSESSSNPGASRALPIPIPIPLPLRPPQTQRLPATVPTLGGGGEGGCGPSGPASGAWTMGRKGWSGPPGDQDAVSCSSTHESILSIYDNLELPKSPTEDSIDDADCGEFESVGVFEHDRKDYVARTENRFVYTCESQEDRSQGTSTKLQKRNSEKPDPFPFTAAESRLEVLEIPQPFPNIQPQTEPLIGDIGEEFLLQGARDLHTTFPLNLSYPSPIPATVLLSSTQPVVHIAQQSGQPSNTMTVLLTSIKQQIAQQREEYETQIRRLEQRNEALEVEVLGLRANLEQQRRWYRAVEMRLCEVERARTEADRRNAELQSQMEQFFDAFGELTNEAKKTERIVQGF